MSYPFEGSEPKYILEIGNYEWEIHIGGKHLNKCLREDQDADGMCYQQYLKIAIATVDDQGKKFTNSQLLDTICHELIHAFAFSYGFDDKERDVLRLAPLLALLFKENISTLSKIIKKYNK